MRWFKHLSVSHDDEFMVALVEEFGAEGYGVWWLVVEQIALQMDETSKTFAKYPVRKWQNECKISLRKLKNLINFAQNAGKIRAVFEEKWLTIDYPNLLKYRDEWSSRKTKKTVATPEQTPEQLPAETELELELETDSEASGKPQAESSLKTRTEKFIPLANRLAEIITIQKKINVTSKKVVAWADEIRKLVESDHAGIDRVTAAIEWYAENAGGEYIPVVESGKALRDKFSKVEDAMRRSGSRRKTETFNGLTYDR